MVTLQQYVLRRLLLVIPTLFGITIVVFMATRFLPGDVVDQLVGEFGGDNPEFRRFIEEKFSLNDSLPRQYVTWIGEIFTGNFGTSWISHRSVISEIKDRIPVTAELALMAMIISLSISIPVGVISAIRQDSIIDQVARSFAIGLIAAPSFWVAIMAITYGFILFDWIPPLGYRQLWDDPWSNINSLWVPAVILGTHTSGSVMRLTRSTMLEVLRQDYVRTAWAKGLRERVIITRHALRNAMIPVITVIGLQIPFLLGGTVILESIFAIPGMGSYFLSSLQLRNYPVVQAIVLISASIVVISNLLVDLAYTVIDPRIRLA